VEAPGRPMAGDFGCADGRRFPCEANAKRIEPNAR
jgi:hypothetical protein